MATTRKPTPAPGGSADEVRAALTAIGKDLRTGGGALYKDVRTLVRSARRDTGKLGKALRGEVERLVKAGAAPPKSAKALPRVPAPRRRSAAPAKKAAA